MLVLSRWVCSVVCLIVFSVLFVLVKLGESWVWLIMLCRCIDLLLWIMNVWVDNCLCNVWVRLFRLFLLMLCVRIRKLLLFRCVSRCGWVVLVRCCLVCIIRCLNVV